MSNEILLVLAKLINLLKKNKDHFNHEERENLIRRLEHVYSQIANFGLLQQLQYELEMIFTAFMAARLLLLNQEELQLLEQLQNQHQLTQHFAPRPTPGGSTKGRRDDSA